MDITFNRRAWDDYLWWQSQHRATLRKINGLIEEIARDPFSGTGKPEPLKDLLSGAWSRRITQEHRLAYLPRDGDVVILQCRQHY